MKTAKQILDEKFKKGFFSEFEEQYALEVMEEYKNQSNPLPVLDAVVEALLKIVNHKFDAEYPATSMLEIKDIASKALLNYKTPAESLPASVQVQNNAVEFANWILEEKILPRDTNWFDAGKHLTSAELYDIAEQVLKIIPDKIKSK